MKCNTDNIKKVILLLVLAFFYNQSIFSQSDTPCAAPLLTLGTSCNYVTYDASVNTKSTTAIAPNPTCPNNQYTSFLAEEDTWYAFVAPAGGSVIISTAKTTGSVYPYASAAVYSGACSSLTQIDCFGGYGGSSYPSFNLTGLTPGNTYYVRFWGLYANGATSPKTHDFCAYTPTAPPANDECINAAPAVVDTTGYCEVSTPGTIEGATESSESYYCGFAGGGDADDDVWFSFVALETTQYFYLNDIMGSTTDLSFSVHDNTFCNSSGVNSLGCNLDFVVGLTIGNTYYVRVWSNSSNPETSTFNLCITSPPVEPSCAANPVAGNTACTATPICNLDGYCGTTSSTYTEDSWPALDVAALCFPDIDNNSFLELTAADSSISFWVWVDNCNQPNGIQIMVFSADTCGSGPVIRHSCWSPGFVPIGATLVSASGLTIGDTYYIMVDGNAGAVCDYTIAAHEGFLTAVEVNSISGDTSICLGSSIDLFAMGGSGIYNWSPATWLNNITSDTVTSTPMSAGSINYTVTSTSSVAICPADTADITLTITTTVTSTDVQTACGSFTWIDGNTYSSNNNTATDTLFGAAVSGCDSIVTLDLTIATAVTSTDVQTACGSYTWIDGNTYSSNNNTATDTLFGAAVSGCDSIVTLDLTITNAVTSTDVQTACGSYTWIDGVNYTASNNTATDTLVGSAANGCDSIVTLDLTITNAVTSTDIQSACGNYTWINGVNYTASNNTATDTLVGSAANGCDSIVTLDLTITNAVTSTDIQSACGNYTWINGVNYTASNNTATDTLIGASVNGCDSIVTLDLTITTAVTSTDVQTACSNYTWIDGVNYTASNNTATDTLIGASVNGCDSIVTLDLTITTFVTSTDVQTSCSNYTWIDGVNYTVSNNTATETLIGASVSGCDSIVSLDLTITTAVTSTDVQTICETYTWLNGVSYTASNNMATYTIVGGSVNGCDSIVTLDLTILNTPNLNPIASEDAVYLGNEVILSVIDSGLNYQWSNGGFGAVTTVSPTETETYNVVASNGVCSDTAFIEIVVLDEEINLLIPTAFSPNGDGVNDLFRIANRDDFMDIKLNIYNRWGELIFNGENENHTWDGVYKSKEQNLGLYIYFIEATAKANGKQYSLSGNVSLIR